ncbi:response regulator transcription factor [Halalkalibacterium halodurans]|uniref:Two-component response regulator n=1 Tax=Halalkalibacterium halodurans (strain ATCC BAA-125 / DSM 18197 / FERM 7344 / JCM 9153 / C-125) TaxID=272558 RepID=Q9KEN2_HALH5|nr:response regulator transcription factor [Halalkalibacterium halodurans]MDY7221319.1 response regulator transcription factor [Halalkalibacterium halodurans]MDY7240558.1 response regulator transcription factor [Halalkalibacterium halodurans]MED4081408.1 response regulator transcription factor [Halalkalibacterium halodurans]MED4083310.1 response regulator transcription factor [Halalkalibacterium halodurans]MED4106499.1 response regulator transcription factor [Halalkalibacterium halodurans]
MIEHKILLIEDDVSISEMVKEHLQLEGYHVCCAFDGEEATRLFEQNTYDLVLLDLMLPRRNGIDCLQWIRTKSVVPVLIMSAKDSDVDKALGLGFGADDYITKPFSMIELTARVKAAIRRTVNYAQASQSAENERIKIHELVVELSSFTVKKKGEEIKLTAKEFQILKLFVTHPKKVFTKEQLYRSVWNDDYYSDENVINVHIRRLREKIEDTPSKPQYIKTIWGIGYRMGEFE